MARRRGWRCGAANLALAPPMHQRVQISTTIPEHHRKSHVPPHAIQRLQRTTSKAYEALLCKIWEGPKHFIADCIFVQRAIARLGTDCEAWRVLRRDKSRLLATPVAPPPPHPPPCPAFPAFPVVLSSSLRAYPHSHLLPQWAPDRN